MSATQREPTSGDLNAGVRPATGLMAHDRVLAVYFALTTLLLLSGPFDGPALQSLGLRAAFFGVMIWARRLPFPKNRYLAALRLAYPVALFGQFYAELAYLNQLITTDRFDALVLGWEESIFGVTPSITLREALPWRPISELLHFTYFAYYIMIPGLFVVLFFKRMNDAMGESVTAVLLTFVVCYGFFILMPVLGPFHYLGKPDPVPLGWFAQIIHDIQRQGSSDGTAFPSSHVAVAMALMFQSIRYDRIWGRVMLVLAPLLAVSTVYGGFHYAIDAVAGLAVTLVTVPIGRSLWRRVQTVPLEGS